MRGEQKMKTKLFKRVMGIALAVTTMFSALPMTAFAEEANTDLTPMDAISENNLGDIPAETLSLGSDEPNEDSDCVYLTMTDEEISDLFKTLNMEETAEILYSLSEDDFNSLVARNTWLSETTTIEDYVVDEETEESISFKLDKEYSCKYYEYILSCIENPNELSEISMDKATFKNSSGYFYINGNQDGALKEQLTVRLSGINTSTAVSTKQKITFSVSKTGAGTNAYGSLSTAANGQIYLHKLNHDETKTNYTIFDLNVTVTQNGNCGYTTSLSNCDTNAGFAITPTYAGSNTYLTETNIASNSTVGTGATNGRAAAYNFNFTEGTYTINFASGSDATHSSGSTTAIVAKPSEKKTLPSCGFSNKYIVSYNLNIPEDDVNFGTITKSNDSVNRVCTGWRGSNGLTYSQGQEIQALATYDGSITMTATWNGSANFVLPNVERPGYVLTGWKESPADDAPVKNVGDTISLDRDKTLYAVWEEADVDVIVNHYIQKTVGGDYVLHSTETVRVVEGVDHTYPLSQDAINAIENMKGFHCSRPTVVTRATSQLDNTPINYYYQCVADSSSSTINNYYNDYGLSKEEVEALIQSIEKNGNATFTINGAKFTIVRKPDGTFTIQFISSDSPVVTVPSFIKLGDTIYNITDIADDAFKGNSTIKTVIVSNGITTIGNYAFYNCKNLENVTLPNTILKIGKYAFAKCPKLKKVVMSKNCYEWGVGIFSDDKALSQITLGSKLAKVPDKAFLNCKKLKSVKIPGTVTQIGKSAFYNCSNLKKVTIKSKALRKVGSKAFKKCKKGLKISVPKGKADAYAKILKGKY